jgi:HD superfamily phosphohydrolase
MVFTIVRIRDPIHGTLTLSNDEKQLIDSRHYQRLRHVRQLGFGDLAFPGATHTRHAHSLGAMHVASRLFDALTSRATLSAAVRERFRAAVRIAVLSHDLGHMPLSHASESIAPARAKLNLPTWMGEGESAQATHEDFTAKMLLDSSLTPIIEKVYAPQGITPAQVAGLVTGHFPTADAGFTDGGLDWTPALRAIVSGELDADRMDYLMRDSFFTGVNYGRFDLEWLLQNVSAEERSGKAVMALSKAGVFAFEDFLLSRYHMFLSVYYHHTSVSFDHMLRRYYEDAPGEFEVPADPEAFLECDDMALHLTLRKSKSEWAQRIVTRRGYKRVAQFTERDEDYDLGTLSSALTHAGVQHFTIESRGVLSKYFDEGHGTSLFVVDKGSGRLTEVSKYTPLYERFAGAVRLTRVYVRPDQLDLARPIVARETGGSPNE